MAEPSIRVEGLVERYGGTGKTSVDDVSSRLATAWRTRSIVVVGGRASWTAREGPGPGGSLSRLADHSYHPRQVFARGS